MKTDLGMAMLMVAGCVFCFATGVAWERTRMERPGPVCTRADRRDLERFVDACMCGEPVTAPVDGEAFWTASAEACAHEARRTICTRAP